MLGYDCDLVVLRHFLCCASGVFVERELCGCYGRKR